MEDMRNTPRLDVKAFTFVPDKVAHYPNPYPNNPHLHAAQTTDAC